MKKPACVAIVLLAASVSCLGESGGPLLLQSPTLSKTQIAFAYGGDIWVVSREGGTAQRLVTGMNRLTGPIFSPDGSLIAYTGEYDGNVDVYVVSASGGDPRRLTYHPGPDVAVAWTPDGKNVLFNSAVTAPRTLESCLPCPPMAVCRASFHCPWPRTVPTRPTALTLPIHPSSSGSPTGRAIGAARQRLCGSRTWPTPLS